MTQDIDVGKLAEQINDKADRDLYNTVPNIWDNTLNTSQITNCITEIPQDIKIELVNGTLTLKAGSKVYVPNGANVYNAVTISSDMVLPKNTAAKYFVFLKDNGTAADTMPVDYCYTGKFEPTITHTYAIWYDTYSYKIKWTGDNGSTWVDGYSLPMCVVVNDTPGTEKVSSKQVFNGFGYVGKTLVFALPGVKGLIPNGRNADGSLKNIEFSYDSVTLTTFTGGVLNEHIACHLDGIGLSPTPIVYDEEVNLNRVGSSYRNDMCDAGLISIDSAESYAITSFNPKTAFYAVDRNDLVNKLNSKQDIATAVNYDNITNCITKIPQNIKLELNNGTLTLKTGSKIYVPNGKNIVGGLRFKETVIESDISLTQSWGSSQTFLLFYDTNGLRLRIYDTGRCYSGTTSVSDGAYYNTNDNKLYVYDGGSLNFTASLPIAIITGQSPTITFIDQVFNGFGYIGSTIYALPGVKGLIPNGRNEDGSLKSIKFENTVVKTYTISSSEYAVYAYLGNILGIAGVGVVDYKEDSNFNFITSTKEPIEQLLLGKVSLNSSKITSFTPKTAFHAVDYNDRETVVGWGMPDYSAGIAKVWNTDISTTKNVRICYGGSSNNQVADSIRLYINNNLIGNYIIANSGFFMQWADIPAGATYKVTGGQSGQYIIEYPFKGAN